MQYKRNGITCLDFAEDNLVPKPMLDKAALQTRLLGFDCHFEHSGLDATSLASTVVDLVKDAIEETGYRGKDGGCKFLKVLGNLRDIATKKANCSSGMQKSDLSRCSHVRRILDLNKSAFARARFSVTCTQRSNI